MPIPRGGGARLVDALVRLIEDHGGLCETGRDVERVLVKRGRATGVRLAGGDTLGAERASSATSLRRSSTGACSMRLMSLETLPKPGDDSASAGRRCRFTSRCRTARRGGRRTTRQDAIVHVTPGLDGVSRAVKRPSGGLLPAEATVVVGHRSPSTLRRPRGQGHPLDPVTGTAVHVKGDAAGQLDVGNGTWTSPCASATPTGSRRGSLATSQTSSRRSSACRLCRPTSRRPTSISSAATRTRSLRSTRTFSGVRLPDSPGTARRSTACSRSARAPWPGPGLGAGSGTLVAKALLQPPAASGRSSGSGSFLRAGQASESPASGRVSRSRRSRPWHRTFAADARGVRGAQESTGSASGRSSFRRRRRGGARAARGERPGLGRRSSRGAVDPAVATHGGPREPEQRIDAIQVSLHRLAPFGPSSIVCLTGPGDDRDTVVEGLQTIGEEAARLGLRIGLEPINRIGGRGLDDDLVASRSGRADPGRADRPALGIQFDSWHVWNTPGLLQDIERYAHRFVGVHIADWSESTRGWCRSRATRATASPTYRGSSARSIASAGTATTTSRSFRTTARLAPHGRIRSGMFRPRSLLGEVRTHSRACGRRESKRRLTRYRRVPCNRPMRTNPTGGST